MRVTIQHREQTTGVISKHTNCYIDCRVEFSEEEKAIIKQRDLYDIGFSAHSSTALPSTASYVGARALRILGRVMMVGGLLYSVVQSFGTNHSGGSLGGLVLFVGIGLEVYTWFRMRKLFQQVEETEQQITIKKLLGNPSFTICAMDPAAAKGVDIQLREDLAAMKDRIKNSAELLTKQSYEL